MARWGAPASLVRRRNLLPWDEGSADRPPWRLPPAVVRGLAPAASLGFVRTEQPVIGLTYDDGPDPLETPDLLDVLARGGARATFFLLADRAERAPELVARILAEGHEIGLHGGDHQRLTTFPLWTAFRRTLQARARLEAVAGREVRLFRPAYGAQHALLPPLCRSRGLTTVLWSGWATDWEPDAAQDVAARAVAASHPGGILLMHDAVGEDGPDAPPSRPRLGFSRAEVSDALLAGLADAGLRAETVSRLIATGAPVGSVWFEHRVR